MFSENRQEDLRVTSWDASVLQILSHCINTRKKSNFVQYWRRFLELQERRGVAKEVIYSYFKPELNILTDVTAINFIHIPFAFVCANFFPFRWSSAL